MSIVKKLQDYLEEYDGIALVPIKDIATDVAEDTPYALAPMGNSVASRDVLGNRTYQNAYTLLCKERVAEETDRADMYDFLEEFASWLEDKNDQGELPELGGKYQAKSLSIENYLLSDIEEDGLGLYQIQLLLTISKRRI